MTHTTMIILEHESPLDVDAVETEVVIAEVLE